MIMQTAGSVRNCATQRGRIEQMCAQSVQFESNRLLENASTWCAQLNRVTQLCKYRDHSQVCSICCLIKNLAQAPSGRQTFACT